jgi:hypothetical protein
VTIKLIIEGQERAAFIEAALEQYYDAVDLFLAENEELNDDFDINIIFASALIVTTISLGIVEEKQLEVLDEILTIIRNKFVLSREGFKGEMQ